MNLRFWNSVPALFVGFGILGTFIGLVWGLKSFSDLDSTQAIREAIKTLLSGVSTAFVTSVWGMVASLLFNILEKWRIGRVSRAIENLQRALDQLFTLTRQEQISIRQEDELKQQTAAFKSVATDFATAIDLKLGERFEALCVAVADVQDTMVQGQTGIIQKLDTVPSNIGKQLEPSFNSVNNTITDTKNAVLEGNREVIQKLVDAPEAFGNAMAEQLAPSLKSLNTAIEELRRQKEESSTDAIRELVEEFQKLLTESVITQMNTLAEGLGKLSEGLMELPEQMKTMITSVQDQIDQTRQLLDTISKEQTNQMEEMLKKMLKAFEGAHNNAVDTQSNTIGQAIQTLQVVVEQLRHALDSTASQTSKEFEAMTQQMRELVDHSANRLDDIFRSGEQSVSTLLQQQGEQIKAINAQLGNSQETLTKGRDMLEQVNTSVTSIHQMIETTQTLSSQLMLGANRLETAGQRLTQASSVFNQENENYLEANRETIAQLQGTLVQSRELLNNFAQRFQTIDTGLQDIFSEIQRGLTEYATTSRSSINEYLSAFSTQLTSAANALAGSVEALGDNVEVLNDMVEGFRHR